MNWMGGARRRIKHSGDKKIKKQFFERKRNGHFKPSLQIPLGRKPVFSQDMEAFCLLENIHAKEMNLPNENLRSIRRIELDKQKNPSLLHHSILGSSPSFDTQSQLMLMEPKYQRDIGWEDVLPRNRKRIESLPMETKRKAEGIGSNFQFISGSSKRPNLFNDSLKYQENPFVSEDFQPTPVVKYLKDDNTGNRRRSKREEKSSDLFPLPQTPALVRQKTFISEQQHVAQTNTDVYRNFNQNPFFETPIKHNEPKKRKLQIEERCGLRQLCIPNRALFDDCGISDRGLREGEKKRIEYENSFRNVNRNSLDAHNSIFSNRTSHSKTNDVHISIPKAIPNGSRIENMNVKSCRNFSLDRILDTSDDIPSIRVSSCSTSGKRKQDQIRSGVCTPTFPIITSDKRNASDRETGICNIKRHGVISSNVDFCEFLDNSFEVSKQNYVRDEMSLLITSTPMERSRKHSKLMISPIPPTSEMSHCVDLIDFHSVEEEAFPKADNQIPLDTMSMNRTVDSDTYCMDLSVVKAPTHPSDTEIEEILAEINQLEEDQAKQGTFSIYGSQTESKRNDEELYIEMKKFNDVTDSFESFSQENEKVITVDDFTKNKYDALLVLQTAQAKLEEYVQQQKVIDQSAIHPNYDVCINSCDSQDNTDEKQSPTQQAEESATPELQPNCYKQNYALKQSTSENCALQNQTILDNEKRNANSNCTNTDTQKNANISSSGEPEIILKTDPQITVIIESTHQMPTSYTTDKKCKCRDSFVLQSSRESQTEIVVESIGVQTERINSLSVGIQCDLFLVGCEGELKAPESQESFHSVASELNIAITNPTNEKLGDKL